MKLQNNTWTLIDFIKYKATATSTLIWYYNWKQPTSPVPGNLIVTMPMLQARKVKRNDCFLHKHIQGFIQGRRLSFKPRSGEIGVLECHGCQDWLITGSECRTFSLSLT